MKEKELKISTLSVDIKVLTIDGKRFTKSVFTQLIQKPLYDQDGRGRFDSVIGFVIPDATEVRYVLWTKDNVMYKSKASMWREYPEYSSNSISGLCDDPLRHHNAYDFLFKKMDDTWQIFIAI